MIAHDNTDRRRRLADNVKHQFKDKTTARLVHALPAFKVVHDVPDHLTNLLRRLEKAEKGGRDKN
jgi:hypothetical protein